MKSQEMNQDFSKKKSLKNRIMITMIICILLPFVILTLVLVLQLISNIDYFIDIGGGAYDSLNTLKIPIIITFIFIAGIISVLIFFAVVRVSRGIILPINQLTKSIETITEGDLTQEIPMDGRARRNEIGILAQAFQSLLVTMRLGNKSYYHGDMTIAFGNYNAALELFRTTNNLHGQGMCLNNLGNIYRNWGNILEARESYNKAIQIGEQENDLRGLSSRYSNRGLLYLSEKRWGDAMNDFTKALEIDKDLGDDEGMAVRRRNIGVLHILKEELDLAQEQLDEAFRLDGKWEYTAGLAEDEFQMGRLALLKKRNEIAEDHLKKSLKYAEGLGNYPLMKNILEILVQLYESQENTALLHKAELELSKINDLLIRKKDVVFVIDQSGSMQDHGKMTSVRTGSLGVFNETINIGDRIAILGFHSIPVTLLELTEKKGNIVDILKVFENLEVTPYQTCLYDTIALAIDMLNKASIPPGEEEQERQKWVVALTDGQDNKSEKYNPRKLAKYIKAINPPLNFILIGVGPELKRIHTQITELVSASLRGKYIPIYAPKDVQKRIASAFADVKEIMASSEIEGFIPEEK